MFVVTTPRIKIISSAVALATLSFATSLAVQAESLGVIHVESSTIGDRFEDRRLEPSAVSFVSGEKVDRAHTENIQQLLQSIPGITTEVQSGDSLKIHIRGVENQVYMGEKPGVAVVIDGVPVFERTGRVNIDLDNIESIRVVKGGASYLFGDDALSGAVIITTKKGAGQAGYKVATEAGSFGHREGLVRAGVSGDNANGHLQISQRKADGYYDDSASQADYVNGKLQYYINDSSDLQFGFEKANRNKNSHGAIKGVSAATTDPTSENPLYDDYANHYDVNLQKLFLTYNRDLLSGANMMVNTYRFTDATDYLSSPARGKADTYNYANDFLQVQRGVKAEYRAGSESFAWMLATDLRDNSYENQVIFNDCTGMGPWAKCVAGSDAENDETAERVVAFYGEAKQRLTEKWLMTLNGRTDRIDLDYTDHQDSTDSGNKQFNVFSSRLGANYAASQQLDYYTSLSTGFRAPSATQLFVGSSSPTQKTAANSELEQETTLNTELGLRRKAQMFGIPVEMDIALFQLDRKDHIQASAGQYSTSAESVYDNIGDMRSRGLELSLLGQPSKQLNWNLAYTYLNSRYTRYDEFNLQTAPLAGACSAGATAVKSGYPPSVTNCLTPYDNAGNEVPRTPNHHLNLAVSTMPMSGLTVTAEMDATSDYYADEINQLKIDGHQVYSLLVNYDYQMSGANWGFFARVDNLFDKDYYNTARSSGDSNDDGIYDAEDLSLVVNQGRTFTAGISATF
ncbi:MAG: TonB-dependent receptor [Gammaproteobacteria bacterium]|nr:TonB-dependent receptor [Gammaproteobacteria bacterium]